MQILIILNLNWTVQMYNGNCATTYVSAVSILYVCRHFVCLWMHMRTQHQLDGKRNHSLVRPSIWAGQVKFLVVGLVESAGHCDCSVGIYSSWKYSCYVYAMEVKLWKHSHRAIKEELFCKYLYYENVFFFLQLVDTF